MRTVVNQIAWLTEQCQKLGQDDPRWAVAGDALIQFVEAVEDSAHALADSVGAQVEILSAKLAAALDPSDDPVVGPDEGVPGIGC